MGAWITNCTMLEGSQPTSIEALLSQHNFSRQDGCGEGMAAESSSSCWMVKWSGATTRGGGRDNTSKEDWITMSKTCGKVVDCWEPTAADRLVYSAINRKWGGSFWAKALGQLRLRGNSSCRSKENLYTIFYEKRILGHALPLYSSTPAQIDTRSSVLKNEAL